MDYQVKCTLIVTTFNAILLAVVGYIAISVTPFALLGLLFAHSTRPKVVVEEGDTRVSLVLDSAEPAEIDQAVRSTIRESRESN